MIRSHESAMVTSSSPTLAEALERVGLAGKVTSDQCELLEQYCEILWEINQRINLTRHLDYDRFAARDVLDSIQLADQLAPNEELLDVGSGGGVPGVLLGILRPDLDVSLAESVQKKARAVEEIVRRLDLPIAVHHARAEDVLEDLRFDTLCARAVGSISKLCTWFAPHWMSIGRLLLIKGPKWVEERAEARHRGLLNALQLRKLASYRFPGADGDSVILQLAPPSRSDPASPGQPAPHST